MRIQHNIPAMAAYRNYTNNTSAVSKNLEKLSSGYKINRAGDDAAGLAVSEKMRAQITGLEAAQKNAKDGISLVQTAEGALTEVHDMLNRMYELAELSSNGTYQDEVDRENYQKEIESLRTEINRIAESVNFNGITLLNGDLASEKAVTKIDISGIAAAKSAATKGVYESKTAFAKVPVAADKMTAGDTFSYTVSLDDNTSTTVNFTVQLDDNGEATQLVSEDGTVYTITQDTTDKTLATPTVAQLSTAILAELKKTDLSKDFTIEQGAAAGQYKFTSLKAGTDAPKVNAMDYRYTTGGKAEQAITDVGVKETTALSDGYEIAASDITLYDGKNFDDAVFTINGHKFVMLTPTEDFNTAGYMNATKGLGDDVTVLVAETAALKGLSQTDKNFSQNIAKIAEVTGLKVTDALNETAYGAAANSGVAPGAGIRLSLSDIKAKGKGLVLQIGDTADDYNKMTVSISDMHADAMGIGSISVATQDGSSDAMKKIKDAINYVSSTRGDLGALQNRLDHTINNLSVMQENIQDAESTIRDVDIAKEMMAYTKNNILVQSAQAMLAQANQLPQGVLQLLQ